MAGAICGVDYAQAMLLARHCDRAPFLELLMIAEQGLLAGVAKKQD